MIDRNSVRAAADKVGIFDHDCISTIDKLIDFLLVYNYQPKEDPEAWREECRKKQVAGVKFTNCHQHGVWDFSGEKEHYREVPQPLPHAAERALWKAQREVGTNEVWQYKAPIYIDYLDIDLAYEPSWHPAFKYRPKPKPARLTAKIARKIGNSGAYAKPSDYEFTGTPDEYRAECEKYGYVVVSEIKEVVEKPKTVKCYTVNIKEDLNRFEDFAALKRCLDNFFTIIGNIEEREVPIE